MEMWEKTAAEVGLPVKVNDSFGCLAGFRFTTEAPNAMRTLFTHKMLDRGFIAGTGFNPMLAHTDADLKLYAAAVREVFAELVPLAQGGESAIRSALKHPEAHTTFARLVK